MELVFLAIVAVAARAESWEEIEEFGKAHIDTLREYFPFENGTPSDCTIRRFFTSLDSSQLNKVLVKYFTNNLSEKHYAIDGKTLRGTKHEGIRALHFLNVYAAESGITLFGKVIDSKKNEITSIPEAIECLDIKGAIVSIDAMGCQKNIAKQIVEKEGEYILGLKMNHPGLYNEVEKAFQTEVFEFLGTDIAGTYEKGHGRIEERKCRIIRDIKKITNDDQWASLSSVIEIKRKVVEKNKVSESVNYYISSSNNSAEVMLKNIRSHWGVESMHWIL
ncbi:ISAs1 family transposase [Candidatus Tisiphia endosymbiont of Hybos culiciformis]|uniref:ISAs1 family transposase n=1 Tax=Candidatus Tisiphia endosymbiont of Hybos culiciformis TaxID=3139331 RepID=UPI003CCAB58F